MAWSAKGTSGYLLAVLHSFYRQRGKNMVKYTKNIVLKKNGPIFYTIRRK
jgi:hypothetical protein